MLYVTRNLFPNNKITSSMSEKLPKKEKNKVENRIKKIEKKNSVFAFFRQLLYCIWRKVVKQSCHVAPWL